MFDFLHILSYNANTPSGERNLHSLSGTRSEISKNAHWGGDPIQKKYEFVTGAAVYCLLSQLLYLAINL